jgi:hypothetical protein
MQSFGITSVLLLTGVLASPSAGEAQVLRPNELCSDHPDAAIATFGDATLEAWVRGGLLPVYGLSEASQLDQDLVRVAAGHNRIELLVAELADIAHDEDDLLVRGVVTLMKPSVRL